MEYIIQLSSRELVTLPPIDVIFLKKWQTDGVYPIYRATKVARDDWRVCWREGKQWTQEFCHFTDESLLKLLHKNNYLVSEVPMYNTDEFNFE